MKVFLGILGVVLATGTVAAVSYGLGFSAGATASMKLNEAKDLIDQLNVDLLTISKRSSNDPDDTDFS